MKRGALLRHLRKHGCILKREGAAHSLWTNPLTGANETVPRHTEIPDKLAHKICRGLSVPELGKGTDAPR
ncbi:MAG TPA: type II toxin-antitoxin system HicA family toxin [Limnochordia bacterium]|nr:type II toxin-antitoxin system HicA family toxin [Limnochordia bacterium]